jgi:L-lactate dehydrogenase complex protein LldG
MNVSPSKENILKNIRKALTSSTPLPFPQSEGNSSVFNPSKQELEIEFAEQFTRLQGKFIFCLNKEELATRINELCVHLNWNRIFCKEQPLKSMIKDAGASFVDYNDLATCDASITSCEALIARTGSIMMTTASSSGRTTSVYAPVHICIARSSQLVYDIKEALQMMKDKYKENLPSLITFATGPSRTADIEKTLVVGVHGPKEVYCLLLQD